MRFTALEAAVYLLWARLTLRRQTLAVIRRRWLAQGGPSQHCRSCGELQKAILLGNITMKVAHRLPFNFSCLAQSLALTAILRRRGIHAELVFGVRQEGEGEMISAHAWVQYGDKVILDSGNSETYESFKRT